MIPRLMAIFKDEHKGNRNITSFFDIISGPRPNSTKNKGPEDKQAAVAQDSQPIRTKRKRGQPYRAEYPSSRDCSQSRSVNAGCRHDEPPSILLQQQNDEQLCSPPFTKSSFAAIVATPFKSQDSKPSGRSESPSSDPSPLQSDTSTPGDAAHYKRLRHSLSRSPSRTSPGKRVVAFVDIHSLSSETSPSASIPTSDHRLRERSPSRPAQDLASSSSIETKYTSLPILHDETVSRHPRPPSPPNRSQATAPAVSQPSEVADESAISSFHTQSSCSSRHITKDGLQGVANTDSEESSDDAFPDVSSFLQPVRKKVSSKTDEPSSATGAKNEAQSSLNTARPSMINKKRKLFDVAKRPQPKKLKNSIQSLVAQQEEWEESEIMIASLETAVEDAKMREQREQRKQEIEENKAIDCEALLAEAGSDNEDRDRMLVALNRTEALGQKERYYFFMGGTPLWPDMSFPVDKLPDEPWCEFYRTSATRYSACVSGFAAFMTSHHPLPVSVTQWMAIQLLYEKDQVLCEAYVEILRVSSVHLASIPELAKSLSSVYTTRSLFANDCEVQSHLNELPAGIPHVIRVLEACAPAWDSVAPDAPPVNSYAAVLDLMIANIDNRVRADLSLTVQVENCIEGLLDALPDGSFEKLVSQITATLFACSDLSVRNRCRAISTLPTNTVRANRLRRRLALQCFSTASERTIAESEDWASSILHSLANMPEFQIGEATDYGLLLDFTLVLDVAISAGWTSYLDVQPGAPIGPWGKLPAPSSVEKQHNNQIDRICKRLRNMSSKIKDAGTSHLSRVEAKVLIEQLIKRLEHGVRARPKPVKGVFGSVDDGRPTYQTTYRQATFDRSKFINKVEQNVSSDEASTPITAEHEQVVP